MTMLQENNVMQLEEEYRRRWHEVITEVTRRLDYQVNYIIQLKGCQFQICDRLVRIAGQSI